MRRYLVPLLVVGLVAGSFVPDVAVAKKKKKKKKPVPVEVTYHINWGDDTCVLSLTPVESEEACADPFAGATSSLGTAFDMAAIDGLPLTLDAAQPIKGTINVQSYYFVGAGPDVMGIGQPQLEVKLAGTSDGEEVVIGELTTEPYTVTPASADYTVEFEIVPPEELVGTVLDDLTLTLQITGNSMFHGVFPADGTSTLTLGALAIP
ncbi:MAG: hypothetical protein ACRDLB_16705 [Actinomycetota bacterium]